MGAGCSGGGAGCGDWDDEQCPCKYYAAPQMHYRPCCSQALARRCRCCVRRWRGRWVLRRVVVALWLGVDGSTGGERGCAGYAGVGEGGRGWPAVCGGGGWGWPGVCGGGGRGWPGVAGGYAVGVCGGGVVQHLRGPLAHTPHLGRCGRSSASRGGWRLRRRQPPILPRRQQQLAARASKMQTGAQAAAAVTAAG